MPKTQRSTFYRFFTSPLMGIAGSIASVIGVGLAFYFYYASVQRPELTYYFHPARATVVSAGQSTALSFTYNGKPIGRDVTTVQVALWNAGRSPIRHDDVLSRVTIQSESKTPILEAKLRKTSRPEIMFTLDAVKREEGIITFDWRALEHNDGASIQLIYLGSPSEKFTVSGSVIGQHGIAERRYGESLKTAQEQFQDRMGGHKLDWVVLGVTLLIGAAIAVLLILQRRRGEALAWYDVVIVVSLVVMLGLCIWQVGFRPNDSPPPFGF